MGKLFGTDGVRGIANSELTCEIAYKLGQAAVVFLGPTIVVGKDTRKSGDMLESAVCAGIMSMGGTAFQAGIIPTPGVALLARELCCDGGVIISASHNPPEYNGIKLVDSEGYKLDIDLEKDIENFVVNEHIHADDLPTGEAVGVLLPVDDACEIYINHAVESVASQGVTFDGLKIALDVGFGAATLTSPEALRRLGAEVTVINDAFDGMNINVECGSTCLTPLQRAVKEIGADIGIAHDGDADRVMLVGETGQELDGDMIEAVCAIDLQKRDQLPGGKVVSTVMCNLGFTHAMREAGIEVVQTQVGDRFVLQTMREQGLALGGEQSGHMIFLDYNSTGDGLVTACQFVAACVRSGKSAEQAASVMTRFPQVLINVVVAQKEQLPDNQVVASSIEQARAELGDAGRILVRPSGTEPMVRVMVEAKDENLADRIAKRIAEVIKKEL